MAEAFNNHQSKNALLSSLHTTATTTTINKRMNSNKKHKHEKDSLLIISHRDNDEKSRKSFHSVVMKASRGGGEEIIVDENDDASKNNEITGRLLLLIVALLYGTLNVTLRLVYALPDPPTSSVLSTTRGWLATACFLPIFAVQQNNNDKQVVAEEEEKKDDDNNNTNNNLVDLWKAGFELAFWNFCSQGLINVGLLSIGSARAAFLTQTSVVLTPIVSVLLGREVVSLTVWIGCVVAMVGLVLLSMAGSGAATAAVGGGNPVTFLVGLLTSLSTGDVLVLGGALCWSLYLFRLSKLAPNFEELSLQFLKTTLLAVFYTIWAAWSIIQTANTPGTSSSSLVSLVGTWIFNPMAWLIFLYSALGPGTIADILQQQGQKYISASETNIILSLEPIFAALVAFGLMGETISFQEGLGGGCILLAALIATR